MADVKWIDREALSRGPEYPLHQRLKNAILCKIKDSTLIPGDLLPPEIELASLYGVSRTTMRRALSELAKDGFLERTPGKGTFVKQSNSSNLEVVALICPFHQSYMNKLASGITKGLKSEGYELIIRDSEHDLELEAREIESVINMKVQGIILWPTNSKASGANPRSIELLSRTSHPSVIVDQYIDGLDTVTTDHYGGGYLLGKHLAANGYSRMAFVTNHLTLPTSVRARWEGFQEALYHNELRPAANSLFTGWPNDFEHWLKTFRPDALFCATDFIAVEVISYLNKAGIRVPEEIAVVGYDDIPSASSMLPPLTTVHQDFYAVGLSVASLLKRRIRKPSAPSKHVTLPVEVQVRASCGTQFAREAPVAVDDLSAGG